ncbi:MAG: saccharopine dehydrogenase family protein [bacterium]
MTATKEFDLIIYGASGFTGRLIADYLGRSPSAKNINWAMAGRNREKLEAVRAEISAPPTTPLVIADAATPATLSDMVQSTKTVISAVGPYQKYGSELVALCASLGTNYVDLCGEPLWMREMILAHEDQAKVSGARIVFSCGFDSIPFDLGVFRLQEEAKKQEGSAIRRVRGRIRDMKGTFSGGTAASGKATMAAIFKDPSLMAHIKDPFALVPDFNGPEQPDGSKVLYEDDLHSWAAPFMMAVINTKNIHRSNALMGHPYGQDFLYDEMILTGDGERGEKIAESIAKDTGLNDENGPKPGEGPSKEERENGSFDFLAIGESKQGLMVISVKGDMDPGYGSTSKMISEAALCVTNDVPDLAGGIYTPAAAFGDTLIHRLEQYAGLSFIREQ